MDIENIAINIAIGTVGAIYTGTIATVLRRTDLDQRIFNFVAPKLNHACAFGAFAMLTLLTLTKIKKKVHKLTRPLAPQSQVLEVANDIALYLNPILSAFSTAYVLNSMSYVIPYRFAAICLIPFWIEAI